VTVLKLPPQDSRWKSTAELLGYVEAEISGWAISKPILAARRLRKDGTRGIRLGGIVDVHNHFVDGTHGTFPHDLSRDVHSIARATHTLGSDRALWNNVLSTD